MKLQPYKLPLLAQGLPIRQLNSGTPRVSFDERIQVNRGDVYMIRPCYLDGFLYLVSGTNTYTGCVVSLNAGGQVLIRETILDNWGAQVDRGDDTDQLIAVNLSDAQTFGETFDWSTVGTQPVGTYQSVLFYTNPEHTAFLKSFKWGIGLGLKRQTFRGIIAAGFTSNGLTEIIGNTVPTGNGYVIGFQLEFYPLSAFNLYTFTVAIDGVSVIENVSINYFNFLSQTNPQFFKVLLEPGSTFSLLLNQNGGAAPSIDFLTAITFFFEN